MRDSLAHGDAEDPSADLAHGGSHGAGKKFDTSIADSISTSKAEQDRRVRAITYGFRGDESGARSLVHDESAKVRSAALGALARMRNLTEDDVMRALVDESPEVRRVICELSVRLPHVDISSLLTDRDPRVVEVCAFALGERGDSRGIDALVDVAARHSDPLCREAAIASLGSIGDERSKSVIIAGLDDIAQIRRRALIALANFEGHDVDDAIRKRLTDRDWQVRQAAEDLLGINAEEQS